MRSNLILLAILAICLAVCAPADAARHDKDLNYFRSAYKATDIANAREDVAGAAAYCTQDYVIISPTGQTLVSGKAEALKQLASTFKYLSHVTDASTIRKCVFDSAGAQVTVSNDTYYTLMMNGKPHPDHSYSVRRELWVKTPGGWLVKSTRILVSRDCPAGKQH